MKYPERIMQINSKQTVGLSECYSDCLTYFDSDAFKKIIQLLHVATDIMFCHRNAVEVRVMRHAEHEAIGAQFIKMVSERIEETGALKQQLVQHAEDEAKHARIFHSLAKQLDKPVNLDYHYEYDINADIEQFGGDIDLFLISTHAAELRNLFILDAYDAQKNKHIEFLPPSFFKAIDEVHRDEINHVSYTQEYVSELVRQEALKEYFTYCIRDYERLLLEEISQNLQYTVANSFDINKMLAG